MVRSVTDIIVSFIKTIASLGKMIATMLEKIIFVTEIIASPAEMIASGGKKTAGSMEKIACFVQMIATFTGKIATLPEKTATSTEMIATLTEMTAKIDRGCKSLNPSDLIKPSDNHLRHGEDRYIRKDNLLRNRSDHPEATVSATNSIFNRTEKIMFNAPQTNNRAKMIA
ncbi:MAG: hypothetical protein DMG11_23885 [Acidobacteria bacterium]|nr:MAG: hypothetical protein DMG11_23885 [Acidobacteriota bacterium]